MPLLSIERFTWSSPYSPIWPHFVLISKVVVKNPANAGDVRNAGLIPELGRPPGGEHSNPLQYSCLEDSEEPGGLQSVGSQRVLDTTLWLNHQLEIINMFLCFFVALLPMILSFFKGTISISTWRLCHVSQVSLQPKAFTSQLLGVLELLALSWVALWQPSSNKELLMKLVESIVSTIL